MFSRNVSRRMSVREACVDAREFRGERRSTEGARRMKWRDGGRRVSGRRRRSRAEGDGLTSASGPRAHRGPSRVGRAARRETPARSTDSTTRLLFLARKWRIAARGGGGGTESDERRARARARRGGRRACSMRRGGRARTLEAGDASGVVARTGTRSRTRSSEEANSRNTCVLFGAFLCVCY